MQFECILLLPWYAEVHAVGLPHLHVSVFSLLVLPTFYDPIYETSHAAGWLFVGWWLCERGGLHFADMHIMFDLVPKA